MSQHYYLSPVFPAKQVYTAVITEVDSDLNIYFRVFAENGTQPIHRVNEAIEKACIRPAMFEEQFTIGKACTAKCGTNGHWQRAVIERIDCVISEEIFLVRFVDYGTSEMVNKSRISSEVVMADIPKLALRGYLYKFKPNESMKPELCQKFKRCLLDKVVDIRWENFLAYIFPMQITIKIPDRGIFKAESEETEKQPTASVTNYPRRVIHSLEAKRSSMNQIRRRFGSMDLNGSTTENDKKDDSTASIKNNNVSNPSNKAESAQSVRPKLPKTAVRDERNEKGIQCAVTTTTGAQEGVEYYEAVASNQQILREKRSRLPCDVLELLDAIHSSPFQELHPELLSNVYYPVVICEYVAENYCFLQTMPIEQPSNDELSITIRHTMFMSLIDAMRKDVNSFNLVADINLFGLPVCAQFEDEEWYRAVVMSNSPTTRKSKVLYIDYGNTREVKYNQLRELPYKYISILPTHSFLVKLHNIRPSQQQTWQIKHSEMLRKTLADITVSLVAIFSQSGYPLEMDIYEASPLNDRVPCRHPLRNLVDSGEFEFVTPPIV